MTDILKQELTCDLVTVMYAEFCSLHPDLSFPWKIFKIRIIAFEAVGQLPHLWGSPDYIRCYRNFLSCQNPIMQDH